MPAKKIARRSVINKSRAKKAKSKVSIKGRFSKVQMIVFVLIFAAIGSYVGVKSFAASTTVSVNSPIVGVAGASSTNDGYWLLGSDGGVFTEGTGTDRKSVV